MPASSDTSGLNSVEGSAATSRENSREVALRILTLDHDARAAGSPFVHPKTPTPISAASAATDSATAW